MFSVISTRSVPGSSPLTSSARSTSSTKSPREKTLDEMFTEIPSGWPNIRCQAAAWLQALPSTE